MYTTQVKKKPHKPWIVLALPLLLLLIVGGVWYSKMVSSRYAQTLTTEGDTSQSQPKASNTAQDLEKLRLERPLGLPCLKAIKKFCILRADDELLLALGIELGKTPLDVGGKQVVPDYIYFQIAFERYVEESITDQAGKTITATKKDYDIATKTLTISIGVQEDYFRLIPESDRKDLYMAQLVRSFLKMKGENPDDFTRNFAITGQLTGWTPNI